MTNIKEKIINKLRKDDVLYDIFCAGAALTLISVPAIAPVAIFIKIFQKRYGRINKQSLRNTFYTCRKYGLVDVFRDKGRVHIELTEKGRKKAELISLQRAMGSKVNKKWDGIWNVVIFDINTEKRIARDALRGLLKRLGFIQMQKSVWIFPFNCSKEINFLRDFFQLSEKELRMITSCNIGDDRYFRKIFNI